MMIIRFVFLLMPKIYFVSYPVIEYELRYMLTGIIIDLMPESSSTCENSEGRAGPLR